MYEILAIVAGVVIGLIAQRLPSIQLKIGATVAGSVAISVIVGTISGELSISWGFLVFDIGQVLMAAVATMAFGGLWRLQHSRV